MIAKEEVKNIILQLETLEEEKLEITKSITGILAESKMKGYDTKVLKKIVKLRKIDESERIKQEEELEIYKVALGMK